MLREPDELIFTVPFDGNDMEPKPSKSYAVYARATLFDKKRDDELPWKGVRGAQRRLFQMLTFFNPWSIVRRASIPSSVRVRSNENTKCFDLSELVKDCDVDLDLLPREPTPSKLQAGGLVLRDYQQSSLRWMLDKENEESSLGIAGELWHRMQFLDQTPRDYYVCELTGSFALNIFEYKEDVQQKDASLDRFSLPTGGVQGLEMGLGKVSLLCLFYCTDTPLVF